jgi:multisubunit Na+/H+ antiporter MnhE subunit
VTHGEQLEHPAGRDAANIPGQDGIKRAFWGRRGGMARWVEAALWWLVLLGLYVILISALSPAELAVGVLAATAGAAAAVAARRALLEDVPEPNRPSRTSAVPLVRALLWLPVQIVIDSLRLARPGTRGHFAEVRPAHPEVVRSGPAMLVLSASPGTYVTAVDAERGTLTVHRIGARPDRLERLLLGAEERS